MFFYLISISSLPCIVDSDCWSKVRPDVHSLYCVNNICQKISGPGDNCNNPTDCASYFYYGPLACSAKCKAEHSCEKFGTIQIISKYCCKAVPENGQCMPQRPNLLNGCNFKQNCLIENNGYECKSGNKNDWIYGMVLSISGNIGISVGINLQKKSYKKSHFKILNINVNYFVLGSILYAIGKILSFAAYIFGNQSLLASLSAFGLISNSIFAPIINFEVFTWKDLCAICCILTGSSIIMKNSGRTNKVYSLCELLKLYTKVENIFWFSFLISIIIFLYFLIKFVETNSDWAFPNAFKIFRREYLYFEDTSIMLRYIMLIFYVSKSAVIAAFTSLFAKSFGEMLEKTINGDNQFIFYVTYIFFILLVSFTFWQIYWLNRALKHYDALLTLPVFHAIWTILSMFNAGIFFSDFEFFTYYQFYGFGIGMAIIFIGSMFLGSRVYDKNKIEALESNIEIVTSLKKDVY